MSYESVAEKYLDIVLRGTDELMCRCPFCDGKKSLGFNIEKGLWICFRCDEKGNAKKLVEKLGGVYATPEMNVQILHKTIERLKKIDDFTSLKVYDEKYLARFQGRVHKDWLARGFTKSMCRRWDLGYDPITDRLTIPYRDARGKLRGIIYRRRDNIPPRYKYPKNFNRKSSLFGSWFLNESRSDSCVLVEGSTDAIKVNESGIPTVAQYGSSLGLRQVQLLSRLGVKKVFLFYDYDEAGRKAEEQARQVLEGFLIYRVVWNEDEYCWHKYVCGCDQHDWRTIAKCKNKKLCRCYRIHESDPGSLSLEEISDMIEHAEFAGRMVKWQRGKYAR